MFKTNFLTPEQASSLAYEHGTPLFVYSASSLRQQAQQLLAIPAPFGYTARFAMKANPHPDILKLFLAEGLCIDASSGYEVTKAVQAGFKPEQILLTSQQLAHNLQEVVASGVQFNATSLHQLEAYGKLFPGSKVSVRLNPGMGSGHSAKTNVGGSTSSFGIWHEYVPRILELAAEYKLTINRVHTHIGSGTDPEVWQQAAKASLDLAKQFQDAAIINLGGGFKVARMDDDPFTNQELIGKTIVAELQTFYEQTGRKLHLELEPGNFLVANAGILLARIDDVVDTGTEGYTFLKLDTGMNDILRPSLYGAQHPIAVLSGASEQADYVVVGHNCESGDLLSPAPGEPEVLQARKLAKAQIGDYVIIGGTGAYCASMSARGYNSFPSAKEILFDD